MIRNQSDIRHKIISAKAIYSLKDRCKAILVIIYLITIFFNFNLLAKNKVSCEFLFQIEKKIFTPQKVNYKFDSDLNHFEEALNRIQHGSAEHKLIIKLYQDYINNETVIVREHILNILNVLNWSSRNKNQYSIHFFNFIENNYFTEKVENLFIMLNAIREKSNKKYIKRFQADHAVEQVVQIINREFKSDSKMSELKYKYINDALDYVYISISEVRYENTNQYKIEETSSKYTIEQIFAKYKKIVDIIGVSAEIKDSFFFSIYVFENRFTNSLLLRLIQKNWFMRLDDESKTTLVSIFNFLTYQVANSDLPLFKKAMMMNNIQFLLKSERGIEFVSDMLSGCGALCVFFDDYNSQRKEGSIKFKKQSSKNFLFNLFYTNFDALSYLNHEVNHFISMNESNNAKDFFLEEYRAYLVDAYHRTGHVPSDKEARRIIILLLDNSETNPYYSDFAREYHHNPQSFMKILKFLNMPDKIDFENTSQFIQDGTEVPAVLLGWPGFLVNNFTSFSYLDWSSESAKQLAFSYNSFTGKRVSIASIIENNPNAKVTVDSNNYEELYGPNLIKILNFEK